MGLRHLRPPQAGLFSNYNLSVVACLCSTAALSTGTCPSLPQGGSGSCPTYQPQAPAQYHNYKIIWRAS